MRTKHWNILLWTAQALLTLLFLMGGLFKATTPIDQLSATIPWVADAPDLARFVGICEVLGAIGLIMPALLRIRPMLVPLASAMLGLVMLLAMAFHITRGEFPMLGVNALLFAFCFFITYGRSSKAVIAPRGAAHFATSR